jgi:hypothetical protein
VVAISLKAVCRTGTERSKPLGVNTQGRGLSPILRFANIRFALSTVQLRNKIKCSGLVAYVGRQVDLADHRG